MAAAQFNTWWQRFARTGNIAPLELRMRRDELRRTLGEPDDFSLENPGRKPRILKYGNLEFHFCSYSDDAELDLIYMETDDVVVSISIPRIKQ